LAAQLAYVNVNTSDAPSAASIRATVRSVYIGRTDGAREIAGGCSGVNAPNIWCPADPTSMMTNSTSMSAAMSAAAGTGGRCKKVLRVARIFGTAVPSASPQRGCCTDLR